MKKYQFAAVRKKQEIIYRWGSFRLMFGILSSSLSNILCIANISWAVPLGNFLSADEIIAMPSMVEASIDIRIYKHSKYCKDKHHTKKSHKNAAHTV